MDLHTFLRQYRIFPSRDHKVMIGIIAKPKNKVLLKRCAFLVCQDRIGENKIPLLRVRAVGLLYVYSAYSSPLRNTRRIIGVVYA